MEQVAIFYRAYALGRWPFRALASGPLGPSALRALSARGDGPLRADRLAGRAGVVGPVHVGQSLEGLDVEGVDHEDEASGGADGFAEGEGDFGVFGFHVCCWVHL